MFPMVIVAHILITAINVLGSATQDSEFRGMGIVTIVEHTLSVQPSTCLALLQLCDVQLFVVPT